MRDFKKILSVFAFTTFVIIALGIVLLIFLPVTGFAGNPVPQDPGPQDHLKCYKVKDPLKVNDDVFLDSSQFGIQEDCKIIGKERFFCGSVEKNETGLFRDALDRICYRIECPPGQGQNPVPEDVEVRDQFGPRILTNFNPHYLCTPAFKPGQDDCKVRAVCGGDCTNPDNGESGICQQLSPGIQDCLCRPVRPDPCDDVGPICDGRCETFNGRSGRCFPDVDGRPCTCIPDIPELTCEDGLSCGDDCPLNTNGDLGVCVNNDNDPRNPPCDFCVERN